MSEFPSSSKRASDNDVSNSSGVSPPGLMTLEEAMIDLKRSLQIGHKITCTNTST